METKMYIYKSPYPSPFQIGREDITQKQTKQTEQNIVSTNKTQKDAQTFVTTNKQDVKPSVSTNRLDVYA